MKFSFKIIFISFLFVLVSARLFAASENDFAFAVISDTHLIKETDGSYRAFPSSLKITEDIIRFNPAFVIHCGDMIHTSYSSQDSDEAINRMWDIFDESVYLPFRNAGLDLFVTKGNHDVLKNAADIFNERWRDRVAKKKIVRGNMLDYYYFTHKNVLFIVMDSAGLSMSSEQKKWLKEILACGQKFRAVFIIAHLGLRGSERHPFDKMDAEAAAIINESNLKITVLSGHHHEYDVQSIGRNIADVILGAAGKNHGAMWLKVFVQGDSVTLKPVFL